MVVGDDPQNRIRSRVSRRLECRGERPGRWHMPHRATLDYASRAARKHSMSRPPRNPFYVILGVVGFLFTITAAAYCVTVLRGIRPETSGTRGEHPMEWLFDQYGTTMLTGEIIVLAIATVGAIWLDHVAGEKVRRERDAERVRLRAEESAGASAP